MFLWFKSFSKLFIHCYHKLIISDHKNFEKIHFSACCNVIGSLAVMWFEIDVLLCDRHHSFVFVYIKIIWYHYQNIQRVVEKKLKLKSFDVCDVTLYQTCGLIGLRICFNKFSLQKNLRLVFDWIWKFHVVKLWTYIIIVLTFLSIILQNVPWRVASVTTLKIIQSLSYTKNFWKKNLVSEALPLLSSTRLN